MAKRDFSEVLAQDPENLEAKKQLSRAKEMEKQQQKSEEVLLKKMMAAAGSFGSPMGFTSVEGERERERDAMMDRLEDDET